MRRVLLLLTVALLAAGCGAGGGGPAPTAAAASPYDFHGPQPEPVPDRPEWVLTDTSGHRYDFRQRTAGRPTLVYFGYTHCPDECPTAMADAAAALRRVSPALASQVVVVFVTTDPRRDTAPVLRRWLDRFSTSFVGLLGTQAQVDAAQQATGIAPGRPDGPLPTVAGHPDQASAAPGTTPHGEGGPLGYAVSHSAVIFAYDAADHLPVVYPSGVTPADIAADLPALARPAGQH